MPNYPDLQIVDGEIDYRSLYHRSSFTVNDKTFTRVEPGEYKWGKVIVFCDQQDSTSWRAKIGSLVTAAYWAPEYAVNSLFKSIEGVHL